MLRICLFRELFFHIRKFKRKSEGGPDTFRRLEVYLSLELLDDLLANSEPKPDTIRIQMILILNESKQLE